MAKYGVLLSQTNTGLDEELACVFMTPLSIINNAPESVSETMSLKVVGSSQGVQRWEIQAEIADSDDASDYFALNVIAGHTKKVYVRMPRLYRYNYTPNGLSPTVTNNYAEGNDTLSVTGFTGVKRGEFIQFSSHPKVYMIENYSGGYLKIYPSLRGFVPLGAQIKYGDTVTLHTVIDKDIALGITYEDGILAKPGEIKFVEKL